MLPSLNEDYCNVLLSPFSHIKWIFPFIDQPVPTRVNNPFIHATAHPPICLCTCAPIHLHIQHELKMESEIVNEVIDTDKGGDGWIDVVSVL